MYLSPVRKLSFLTEDWGGSVSTSSLRCEDLGHPQGPPGEKRQQDVGGGYSTYQHVNLSTRRPSQGFLRFLTLFIVDDLLLTGP